MSFSQHISLLCTLASLWVAYKGFILTALGCAGIGYTSLLHTIADAHRSVMSTMLALLILGCIVGTGFAWTYEILPNMTGDMWKNYAKIGFPITAILLIGSLLLRCISAHLDIILYIAVSVFAAFTANEATAPESINYFGVASVASLFVSHLLFALIVNTHERAGNEA